MGPRNHVLDGSPDPPWAGAILREKERPIVKYRDIIRSSVQKRLNRSICCLGCGLGWAQEIMCYMEWGSDLHEKGQFWGWGAYCKV